MRYCQCNVILELEIKLVSLTAAFFFCNRLATGDFNTNSTHDLTITNTLWFGYLQKLAVLLLSIM